VLAFGEWLGRRRSDDKRIQAARTAVTGHRGWCQVHAGANIWGVLVVSGWPQTEAELVAVQQALATSSPALWHPADEVGVAGCFAAPSRGLAGTGATGDRLWAGAAVFRHRRCLGRATVVGQAGGRYRPGLLALRIGPVLDTVVRSLPVSPDVLLVDATGRDHPRGAGLATHLGAMARIPTIGVTHRPLLASGVWPADERGARSPLMLAGRHVGYWLRTRAGRRPLAVHAAWRTDPDTAARVVLEASSHRTPRPLREARSIARQSRAADDAPGR
jgi:deoxyribonuclease V